MNDNMTPEQQRRLRVKIAANARWSRHMAREDQAVIARAARVARLERQIDPEEKILLRIARSWCRPGCAATVGEA